MAATSSYQPLQTSNQPGGSSIIDQNFKAIKAALDQVMALIVGNMNVVVSTGNYSVKSTDQIILMNPGAGITVNVSLPDATKSPGFNCLIKNISPSGTVTVTARPNQLLEGSSAAITLTSHQVTSAISDGSNIWI